MFFGWEGVGLASYLLIGFWYEDPEKATAGMKAFVVNRFGDFGFIIGLLLLFWGLGGAWEARHGYLRTTDYVPNVEMNAMAAATTATAADALAPRVARRQGRPDPELPRAARPGGHRGDRREGAPRQRTTVWGISLLTLVGMLLFVGATGKSAQIPLYVWLPDAMAGPTPVSALIHAATMVTAGVYMVARLNFLFALSPRGDDGGGADRRAHRRSSRPPSASSSTTSRRCWPTRRCRSWASCSSASASAPTGPASTTC